jgi:VanZ family protein
LDDCNSRAIELLAIALLPTLGVWIALGLSAVFAVGLAVQFVFRAERRDNSGSAFPPPRRGHFVLCCALFALFALYASLIPFRFQALTFGEARVSFEHILRREIGIDSFSDCLANILLALPLGFFASAAWGVDRPRFPLAIWQVPLVIATCACFSATLEFLQLWIPARTSSQNDVAAQTIGAAFGAAAWLILGQRVTHWARGFFAASAVDSRSRRILQAYCAILFFYSVLPLDITISPAQLYHKWRDGQHVVLVPRIWDDFSRERISETLATTMLFATVGMLAARPTVRVRIRTAVFAASIWGLSLATAIELAQLFVASRFTKTSDIVLGAAAAALGGAARWWVQQDSASAEANRAVAWRWSVLALVYTISLLVVFTAPFQWLVDSQRIAKRWRNLWNIPFGYSKYWGDPLEALSDVMKKLLLFASLAALLTTALATILAARSTTDQTSGTARRQNQSPWINWFVLASCAALATAIEMLQVYLPPHVADITDVLVATLGASLGVLAASAALSRSNDTSHRLQ